MGLYQGYGNSASVSTGLKINGITEGGLPGGYVPSETVQTGVSLAISELAESRRYLGEQFGLLYERLTPVCVRVKENIVSSEGVDRPQGSEIASALLTESAAILEIAASIRSLISTLDI